MRASGVGLRASALRSRPLGGTVTFFRKIGNPGALPHIGGKSQARKRRPNGEGPRSKAKGRKAESPKPALFRRLLLLPKQPHNRVDGILLLLVPRIALALLLTQHILQQPTGNALHVGSELRI